MFSFLKRSGPRGPSEEAKAALSQAAGVTQRADVIYNERGRLLRQNHFAERIRILYEGN